MGKEDISAVCLNCKIALASLGTIVDETQNETWKNWLSDAAPEDAALLLKMLDILTVGQKIL